MPKATQLTVSVQNQPGALAHVANILGKAGVNIVDFLTGATGAAGFVQVVVDDVGKAQSALQREGLSYTEQEVLCVELPDKPGALGEFAGKLAAKNININVGYATTVLGATTVGAVLAVSDLDEADRIQ